MGLVKQAWIEAQEYVWAEAEVEFTCPECGKDSDGCVDIPKIHEEFPNEIDTDISVQCIWCEKNFDAELSLGVGGGTITLSEYPETKVNFEPIFFSPYIDDNWLEEEYFFDHSDDPFSVFQSSHDDVVSFSRKYGDDNGHNHTNRMIFAQSFSVFEAYLCDTFLNLVFFDESNQNLFMQQHNKMKNATFSVSDLLALKNLSADEIIIKKITQVIKETLFHNLQKAVALFRLYKIDMFPTEEGKEALFKAVEYRHHCVHRNGHDLEGNKLGVYTEEYNLKIASYMMESAKLIEANIAKKKAAKHKI